MKKALIVSFPRSGTHFLMNTLQLCFNYDNNGHGNLEPLGFNFHVPNNVHWVLTKMDAVRMKTYLKCTISYAECQTESGVADG